jgi:peptidoglycan/LPS O-acetylase OafA/YrhL
MNAKFTSIEGLRGWMAWWVVAGHALKLVGPQPWLPAPVANLLLRADYAVDVFIIVSGFVITHLFLTRQEPYADYIWRRFLRIVPVYLFCLLFAIATAAWYQEIFASLPWVGGHEMHQDRIEATQAHWQQHLAAHLTLLHGVVPDNVLQYSTSSFLGPAWSLSLEWQFYLVAPLILWLMTRGPQSALLTVGVLLGLSIISKVTVEHLYQYPAMLLLSIQFFLVGIVSRLALQKLPPLKVRPEILMLAALAAVAYSRSVTLIIWTAFFIFVLRESGLLADSKVLSAVQTVFGTNRVIRDLGKFSYSTYLVHVPIFAAVGHYYGQWYGLHDPDDMRSAIAIAIAVVLILSPLMYRLIEKPFIELGRRTSWAKQPVAPAPILQNAG